jgi:hypothetical protein
MPQANWVIILHTIVLWGSVFAGLTAGWRLPVSYALLAPLGIIVWVSGFLYNLKNIRRFRRRPALSREDLASKGYRRIFGRTAMNLGVGLASGSWLTLIAAALLIPFYVMAANQRRQYLDYLRSGMLSDVFPDRTSRRWQRPGSWMQ